MSVGIATNKGGLSRRDSFVSVFSKRLRLVDKMRRALMEKPKDKAISKVAHVLHESGGCRSCWGALPRARKSKVSSPVW